MNENLLWIMCFTNKKQEMYLPNMVSHLMTWIITSPDTLTYLKTLNMSCGFLLRTLFSMLIQCLSPNKWIANCAALVLPWNTTMSKRLTPWRTYRAYPTVLTVTLRHVYREYNSDADGVCNEVLNLLDAGLGGRSRTHQICVNWTPFRDVDADGDTVIGQ